MRYSYEFKVKCVKMYRKGCYPPTPDGITTGSFRNKIREWAKRAEQHGMNSLKHMQVPRNWTADEKLNLVLIVLSGRSIDSVAVENNISHGQLSNWVKRYRLEGYEGLVNKNKGRYPKENIMPAKKNSEELTESEREELIRLRAENEYIKAEIEVIKKEIALRHEKWAAELKAKKQRSSKNSVKKDTD